MMFITAVDKLIKPLIIFNDKGLICFLRCALLVSKVWIAEEYRGAQDGDNRYPQVILKAGAIRLGGLP
jgi:hypothetical protein